MAEVPDRLSKAFPDRVPEGPADPAPEALRDSALLPDSDRAPVPSDRAPVPSDRVPVVADRVPAAELRASDADRERVASVLREAAAEGRLDLSELDERLGAVYAARTYAELEPVTRDLPGITPVDRPLPVSGTAVGGAPTSSTAVAIMGGFQRRGPWIAPRRFTAFAFWGGGEIDLREARYAEGEVTIRAFAIMGGIQVTVPEDAEVHVSGVGIMGGFDHRASGAGQVGGPRIIVKGFAFWGGVDVQRRASDAEEKRRKLERKMERKRAKLERKQFDA